MKESKWEWKVIRVDGITVAQGYKCPLCGVLQPSKICWHCGDRERKEGDLYEKTDE